MRICILIVFLITSGFCTAQNKPDTIAKRYMPLKHYKLRYSDKPLTKNDSANFFFHNNDTLVLLDGPHPKNLISVRYEYKDSTFLDYYKKAAFNHTADSVNKKTTMKYWKNDIKIFFSKSVSKTTKKDLMSFAKTIAGHVDSLRIYEVKRLEDSNYIIYYTGDYEYEAQLTFNKDSRANYSWWNGSNQIYRHTVRLNTQTYFSEKLLQYKLRKAFIISLGYFRLLNDLDCENYFSNCYSENKKLTALDIEILKYHYSYGICKGTSLETFEKQHEMAQRDFARIGHYPFFSHSN